MRAREFMFEGDLSPSISNLVSTLETLRDCTDQIRVDSLVNIMRKKPGSEMFNIDILSDAYEKNDVVKNMIRNITDDETGVKYVYLKSLTDDDIMPNEEPSADPDSIGSSNPELTVSSMAKRAIAKRS